MKDKQGVNIILQIKYGKFIEEAGFLVHNLNGLIICDAMCMNGKPMMPKTKDQYFDTNYSAIKKQWYKQYGEVE